MSSSSNICTVEEALAVVVKSSISNVVCVFTHSFLSSCALVLIHFVSYLFVCDMMDKWNNLRPRNKRSYVEKKANVKKVCIALDHSVSKNQSSEQPDHHVNEGKMQESFEAAAEVSTKLRGYIAVSSSVLKVIVVVFICGDVLLFHTMCVGFCFCSSC